MSANPQSAALERIRSAHAAAATRLPGGEAWRQRRADSLSRLMARGLPSARDESWRYADLRRITEGAARDPAADAATHAVPALPAACLKQDGLARVVLVDGVWQPQLGTSLPGGLHLETLASALEAGTLAAPQYLRRPEDDPADRLALLADAWTANGIAVRVDAAAASEQTLYLVHLGASSATTHTRVNIEIGAGASLRLIEHRPGTGEAGGFANLVVDLQLDRGASVQHLRILEGDAAHCRVDTLTATVAAAGRYEHHQFSLGGGVCRTGLTVDLAGPGASTQVQGLILVDAERRVDLDARIRHLAPATKSEHVVRGIGVGPGQGAISSRIFVDVGAQKTDSRQSLRNLLLTPGAEIDVRPQLEINADDVRCSHGATTGALDPAQLFYLLSRGIERPAAQALLTFAFCEDVLANLQDPALRRTLEERVVARLPDRDVIREFI